MQTIDFHSHLLNPNVSFSRLYDKVAISLFAKKLGVDKNELINRKYDAFVESFINNIKTSKHIKKSVILPVDAKIDIKGDEIHRDKTVCSSNEDVYKEYQKYPNEIIPFFSINPNRKDALDLIDKYASLGFKGAKFLQNYWDIDINDKKYSKYFEKIKSYNLPIIIHSGSEYAISSNPKYEKIEVANQAIEIGCKVVLAHVEDLAKNQKQIHHKLLFGTDYPVPFSILFSHNSLGLKKRLELEKIQNPLDRYISFFNEYFEEDSPVYNNWQKLIKE
ncbi:amidohydrolase family protein [Aliarcobacter butzleri]|uniref:amidohydrolase family protein n=1 Tax=Aliarcobacter butzleri TaxID=28197 RepID=UPI00125F3041|nr:amidohydrolase family protein [Aliarcobacter butzleri]